MILALMLMAALAAPAAAQAQLTWSPEPQPLSPEGHDADQPRVAMDAHGNAVVVRREFDGANYRIRAAFRRLGQNFEVPGVFISKAGADAGDARVAMDAAGNAIAVWTYHGPASGGADVEAAVRPAGGAFGASQPLSTGDDGASTPAVAMDPRGNALVLWRRFTAAGPAIEAVFRPAGGDFGAIQHLATAGNPADEPLLGAPDVAFDAAGNAIAAWPSEPDSWNQDRFIYRVMATVRPAGGQFETPQQISPENAQVGTTQVAMHEGTALVVWGTWNTERSSPVAAVRPAGGAWQPAHRLAGEEGHAGGHEAVFDPQGNAFAGWFGYLPGAFSETRVETAFRPAGGDWSAPAVTSQAEPVANAPQIGVDRDGEWVLVWAATEGTADRLYAMERSPGPAGTFGAAQRISGITEIETYDLATSATGDTVVVWARGDGENQLVEAAFGTPPGAPPPPPPPPRPLPPNPSAIQTARKPEPGKALVLTAVVDGPVDRLEWDFDGAHPPIVGHVVDGNLQRSVRLRPRRRQLRVTLRAHGPGGVSTFARSFTLPRPPRGKEAIEVRDRLERGDVEAVYAVGDAETLTGRAADCGAVTVFSGRHQLSGCLRPIEELADIPGAERGVLEPLARELGLERARAELMRTAVELTDGYAARGRAMLNGVWPVVPEGGASLVSFPQAEALVSSNASLQVAGLKVGASGAGFNLKLDPSKARIPLGAVPRPPSLPRIGGFELVGDWDVDLETREATIKAHLKLPSFLKKAGVDIQNEVKLRATPDELIVDEITIGPIGVHIGALAVDEFRLRYTRAGDEWHGQGKACVIGDVCLDMVPPNGQVKIKNGRLDFAGASLGFPMPGIPLFSGVHLERIGFGFGLDPTRFTGNARLGFGHVLVIDGRMVIAFPTAQHPFFLRRDEVGNDFPAHLYNYRYTGTTIGISAGAALRLPAVGEVPLAQAYVLYEYPGYLALGGGVNYAFREPVTNVALISVGGRVDGEFNAGNGRFNIDGRVHACVVDIVCKGADGNVSSSGMAVCTKVDTFLHEFHVGGAMRWSPFKFIPYLDGCNWGRFREPNVRGARAAQAGRPYTVRIDRDDPSRMVMLEGAAGAPRVRVTGPGGQLLDSPAGSELVATQDTKIRVMRSQSAKFVAVGFADAAPGTYTIETVDGSAAISDVKEARALPDARAAGTVRGRGKRRVLTYRLGARPNQTVSFFEVGAGGTGRQIGGATKKRRGRIAFSPAPGHGTRRVEARFELDGVPAETRVIARFRPPSPVLAAPRALRVRRAGKSLRVSWRRVKGATRYEVAATTAGGLQRFRTTRKARTAVRVPRTLGGRVTVRAVDRQRQSVTVAKRFRRTARPRPQLQSLASCRVGRRVVCRR